VHVILWGRENVQEWMAIFGKFRERTHLFIDGISPTFLCKHILVIAILNFLGIFQTNMVALMGISVLDDSFPSLHEPRVKMRNVLLQCHSTSRIII
jgi:hypothetical protein